MLLKIKNLINKIESSDSEKILNIFALLPFFFNWLVIFSRKGISENCRKSCIRSGFFSVIFFVLLLISFVLSLLPMIGPYVGNIVHLLAIVLYIGLSGIFIYAIHKGKIIELNFVEKVILKLNEILN